MVCRRKEKKKVHRLLVCREEGPDAQHRGQATPGMDLLLLLLSRPGRDRAEGHGPRPHAEIPKSAFCELDFFICGNL